MKWYLYDPGGSSLMVYSGRAYLGWPIFDWMLEAGSGSSRLSRSSIRLRSSPPYPESSFFTRIWLRSHSATEPCQHVVNTQTDKYFQNWRMILFSQNIFPNGNIKLLFCQPENYVKKYLHVIMICTVGAIISWVTHTVKDYGANCTLYVSWNSILLVNNN